MSSTSAFEIAVCPVASSCSFWVSTCSLAFSVASVWVSWASACVKAVSIAWRLSLVIPFAAAASGSLARSAFPCAKAVFFVSRSAFPVSSCAFACANCVLPASSCSLPPVSSSFFAASCSSASVSLALASSNCSFFSARVATACSICTRALSSWPRLASNWFHAAFNFASPEAIVASLSATSFWPFASVFSFFSISLLPSVNFFSASESCVLASAIFSLPSEILSSAVVFNASKRAAPLSANFSSSACCNCATLSAYSRLVVFHLRKSG